MGSEMCIRDRSTPTNAQIPLGELATIKYTQGPPLIRSENARLTGWVLVDINHSDLRGYVGDARRLINESVQLPVGYAIEFSGQYEQLLKASKQLSVAIPAVVVLIFIMLMLHFGRLDRTLLIMSTLPFAMVGGIWAIWFAGYSLSVAAAVGFIALGGVAIETALIMVLYIDEQVRQAKPVTKGELLDAIREGAVMRLRPKLMTTITIIIGLAPIFLSDGFGADVMRRIALPVFGGMLSTLVLTLIVVPTAYYLWIGKRLTE